MRRMLIQIVSGLRGLFILGNNKRLQASVGSFQIENVLACLRFLVVYRKDQSSNDWSEQELDVQAKPKPGSKKCFVGGRFQNFGIIKATPGQIVCLRWYKRWVG